MIQGIASGIGFLGAGTILKLRQKGDQRPHDGQLDLARRRARHAAGLAEYALAVASAAISLFVLGVLGPVEKFFEHRNRASARSTSKTIAEGDRRRSQDAVESRPLRRYGSSISLISYSTGKSTIAAGVS